MSTPEAAVATGLDGRQVLGLTLHHEAGAEPLVGLLAVACVIRTRVRLARRANTSYADVCLAAKQFSCWRPSGGRENHAHLVSHAVELRTGRTPAVLTRAFVVADLVMFGLVVDPTGGADHYYAPDAMVPRGAKPDWIFPGGDRTQPEIPAVAIIHRHRFYRLRRPLPPPRPTSTEIAALLARLEDPPIGMPHTRDELRDAARMLRALTTE